VVVGVGVGVGVGVVGRRAGDDGGRGVDRADVAWLRGEASSRARVTSDPSSPGELGGRIMMTSASDAVSRP
jgi:hypothetical protein